ncbi:tRNA-queuosine alpha-mannosyltransferase-like [Watersipora subatra]|uniref:tRNA-queuosine alpha-mannosyltransferase-like n=1 Tax=Watersipora subatra TaxID=2589382 RepID=UPI00355B8C04
MDERRCIIVEPFYGGSHKQLLNTVFGDVSSRPYTSIYTLPAKKWHWKARTSALYFSQQIPLVEKGSTNTTIFASSVLNLAELVALRPDLAACRKLLYFHENQLQYPLQKSQQRDFQYGYNQILSGLVADINLFNSRYNMESFLEKIPSFLKTVPDGRADAQQIVETLRIKSRLLYFALDLPPLDNYLSISKGDVLHIVWPHRWEHDKDPNTFFQVLEDMKTEQLAFRVSILGEKYNETPEVFKRMQEVMGDYIVEWGYQESKEKYYQVLSSAHVVVSTALHEFFGVAMLEAVHFGCYPLAPHGLAYPEHFPEECLYRTTSQLTKKLRYFSRYPHKTTKFKLDVSKYSWQTLREEYEQVLAG